MKVCVLCGKSLRNRRRKVTPKLTMRCANCDEPALVTTTIEPVTDKNTSEAFVAKPNNIIPVQPKKRSVQRVTPAVNGKDAKPGNYVKIRKQKKAKSPTIDKAQIKSKKDKK